MVIQVQKFFWIIRNDNANPIHKWEEIGMFTRITIEYCVEWNYYPQAASLAKAIENEFNKKPELIKSGGGVFEIKADDTLIFSKKREFRFPNNEEIIQKLKNL